MTFIHDKFFIPSDSNKILASASLTLLLLFTVLTTKLCLSNFSFGQKYLKALGNEEEEEEEQQQTEEGEVCGRL